MPILFAPCPMIGADRQKAGILPLASGIGLQGHGIEAGDLGELRFKLVEKLPVAPGLLHWHEGMQLGKAGPGHRDHFRGRVQLHRAGAKRDHGAIQRQILGLQPLEIAEHLGFAAVKTEDGMVQKAGGAAHRRIER